jgi:hypothetical protein
MIEQEDFGRVGARGDQACQPSWNCGDGLPDWLKVNHCQERAANSADKGSPDNQTVEEQ